METTARPVVEVTEDTIRVGDEVRPLHFTDHTITGWLFVDGCVVGAGRWDTEDWSPAAIAEYQRVVVRYNRLRWLPRFILGWLRVQRPLGDHRVLIQGVCTAPAMHIIPPIT